MKKTKYVLPDSLRYLLDFEVIGFAKFRFYQKRAGKYRIMIVDNKIPDCSKIFAHVEDVHMAIDVYDGMTKDKHLSNDEICIEWDMPENITVQKKFYKKFQSIDFNTMHEHPLFQSLSPWERDTLGIGLNLSMTGINVYYTESHDSYFTGIPKMVVRVGRPRRV